MEYYRFEKGRNLASVRNRMLVKLASSIDLTIKITKERWFAFDGNLRNPFLGRAVP